ncbi:MAG: nucleotidyltransferase domain-containing protein [Candidatus Delongbacteria bacterium]|jgi:predicted nucleotidyltransferase|nr:nucleotidyltransferase domain-containing protein [Candidatus Delongbacteria bacterium]
MNTKSDQIYEEVKKLFNSEPTPNQKAWRLIHEFYHMILTEMEEKSITRAEIAKRLGKSKASVSKMLNNTPNITVKKMVELADCVGIDLKLITNKLEKKKKNKIKMFSLKDHIPEKELNAFCKKYKIKSLSLFGSAIRNELKPESDIDILIEFEKGATPGLITFMGIQQELTDRIGRQVDLRTRYDLSDNFRDSVVAESKVEYVSGR